ncbi:MAG TPA: phytanoyl-CoA dioxygenase family protein [Caldilineaceae bacterium]|nr:phytanoyl-CoA dioxygenase family protein [Caldilineaceae bacterium]
MSNAATAATIDQTLAQLQQDGFLLIHNALDPATVAQWKTVLYDLYAKKQYEISNGVGNVAFEKLLALQPEAARALMVHPSTSPYLQAILGQQCQLRSLRAHVNPGAYLQEWHMDFYDYYYQVEKAGAAQPVVGLCMNVTFYLTDNTPEHGRLTFVKGYLEEPVPAELRPNLRYTEDRNDPFQRWCDEQEHVDLHPLAGDAVVFYSHIPHQGAKFGVDPEGQMRANIVLHYQQNPMFPGIRFVSDPQFTLETLGYRGTFPFAE